ncbi:hypothetical protein JG687_00008190, partial [Phytophthora cactorum]
ERKEARRLASKRYYWRKKAVIFSWFDLYGKTSKRFPPSRDCSRVGARGCD